MKQVLCSWIGDNDLKSFQNKKFQHGPMFGLLSSNFVDDVDQVLLLGTRQHRKVKEGFTEFLKEQFKKEFFLFSHDFEDPTDFHSIYEAVRKTIESVESTDDEGVAWSFYISPGTSHMAAVWLLLGKTIYNAIKSNNSPHPLKEATNT